MLCWAAFCSSHQAPAPNVCIKPRDVIHPWIPHSPAALRKTATCSFRYQHPSQINRIHDRQWSIDHKNPKHFLYRQQNLYYTENTWVLEKGVWICVYTEEDYVERKRFLQDCLNNILFLFSCHMLWTVLVICCPRFPVLKGCLTLSSFQK